MRIPQTTADQIVVGVVVTVPEPSASELRRVRVESGDPLGHAITPHITLVPPVAIQATALEEVKTHLGTVSREHQPFTVRLRGTQTFRPVSPVVYMPVHQGAARLEALEAGLRAASGPLDQPTRFDYHPHVTLAQEIDDASLDRVLVQGQQLEAEFQVKRLHLAVLEKDLSWAQTLVVPLGG